jgi:hypothetical protein
MNSTATGKRLFMDMCWFLLIIGECRSARRIRGRRESVHDAGALDAN